MVDEDVTVRLDAGLPGWSCVECVFVFENQGLEKEVVMGFPGTLDLEDDLSSPERVELGGLEAYVRLGGDVDWREVPVGREAGVSGPVEDVNSPKYDFWYTFPVRFGAGERLSIRNIYRIANPMWSNGFVGTGYVISTGRFWKGNIGHARVTFDLGGIPLHAVTSMFPGTFRVERTKLAWEASDFEPSFDLELRFNIREYDEKLIAAMGIEGAVAEAKATFDLVETLDPVRDATRLRDMLESAVARKDLVLAGFIGTRLNEVPKHPPLFSEVYVRDMGEHRDLEATLSDVGADVVSFQGSLLYGRRSPLQVVCEWSYVRGSETVPRHVGRLLPESVDPSKDYVLRLMARDSTGSETLSEFVLGADGVRPAGNERPGPPMTAVLVGLFVLGTFVIGYRWVSLRRRIRR